MHVSRQMLNELDAYELKLLVHYRLNADGNSFAEPIRTTAAAVHMSCRKVMQARDSLKEKGYLASVRTHRGTEVELA